MLDDLRSGTSRAGAALALAGASLVAAAAGGAIFLSTAREAWEAIDAAGPAGPADGILLVAGLGGTLLSLWLGLGLALSALSALPGALGHLCKGLAGRVAPAAVRNVVAFVLGTTLTAALVPGTAVAGVGPQAPRSPVVAAAPRAGNHVNQVMDAAPSPTWSPRGSERRPSGKVVVLRGDTLWSIAAKHLGPASGAADIDAEWRRWYATNKDVIGENANHILPGQLLRPPSSPRAGS